MRYRRLVPWCCLAALLGTKEAGAQGATGFANPYYTTGTRIAPSTLVPTVRKWYLPQRLYGLYGWQPEEYTNYARQTYEIYNPIALEGVPYYDQYRAYITGAGRSTTGPRTTRRRTAAPSTKIPISAAGSATWWWPRATPASTTPR